MAAVPLVSVVIPTKDRNPEVRRAIASALRQTVTDIEVIVVDDGSIEPTAPTLADVGADSRVTIHRNESPTGPSAARNAGIDRARGSFVAFLDSDDEWHPTKIEQQVAALRRRDRDAGLSLCGFEVVDDRTRRARVPREVRAGNVLQLLDTRHGPTVSSCFVLPTALARTTRFDEALPAYEDLDLAARISMTHDVVSTRAILVRKHVSAERQFSGAHVLDARRALLTKYADTLRAKPAVLVRHQITMAAELARGGRTDDARALLGSVDAGRLSPWLRIAQHAQPRTPARLSQMLDALRLAERFSVRDAVWRVQTSRLRWQT